MGKNKSPAVLNYGLAVLSVAAALGVSLQFRSLFAPIPAIPFLVAVMASTRFGGLLAGLSAIFFSALALRYVALTPTPATFGGAGTAQLAVFIGVALLLTVSSERRRKVGEVLRESEARLRLIVAQNADGIIIVDDRGKIRLTNPAAEAILGRSSEELRNVPFGFPLIAGEAAELNIPRRNGEQHGPDTQVVEMRAVRTVWEGEEVFLASLRDVTERKRLEETLRTVNSELERRVQERTAELQRVNTDLKQLAYVSAHDLQEPVRTVAIYTQRLEQRLQGHVDPQASEYLGYLVEGATRMAQQLNDLMRYTEIETLPQQRAEVDCCALLRRVLSTPPIQATLQEKQATVTYDSLPTVMANEAQLRLVFMHLLQNALTFCSALPPQIHISAALRDQHWQIAVRDNGIGIDPRYTEQIFHLFERLHPRKQYPGTGMGLPICKKVIEHHNGRIWVESELGKGATFFFTLPHHS